MDESRESGNSDGLEKSKSKKHKKHKKSKKAAITLDEFLNMNKDVFGDGLDVQGIEEVPTQHVLKKCKGKKDNSAKTIPASAIAKLKKQGITVKSNSGPNSPTFKTNRNVNINKATNIVPNRIPVMNVEKLKPVTTSSELLTKLLNQGNSQIKIVKKLSAENCSKDDVYDQADILQPASSNIKQMVSGNDLSAHRSDEEITNGNSNHETGQNIDPVQAPNTKLLDTNVVNHDDYSDETDMDDNQNLPTQEYIGTLLNKKDNLDAKALDNDCGNDENMRESDAPKPPPEASCNLLNKEHETDMHINDNNDSFETNEEDIENNASDDEDIPNDTHTKNINDTFQENLQKYNNKSLDALKHLSGLITIKPAHSVDNKSDLNESDKLNEHNEPGEIDIHFNVPKILSKNSQNVCLKKTNAPQKKSDTSTKSIDALKTLNKQLTITPCVTSTTKCNEESDDEECGNYDIQDNLNISNKNVTHEKDNANFKTPMSITKQLNTTTKPSHLLNAKTPVLVKNTSKGCIKDENTFNMDILKRLTNVTAKPLSRTTNSPQVNSNQSGADSRMSVIQKIEKNKQIDEDIEIFNIDDSDSDQEFPDEESVDKQIINTPPRGDTASVNVLKNLSKNITVKPTNLQNKSIINVKKEMPSDTTSKISDVNSQSSINNDTKNIALNKHMNINLNNTLKKLGNNISIKSQYASPDSHRFQMLHDDDHDIDGNFDMNDEGSDSENTNRVKITEMQEDDEDLPSDTDMEHHENVIVQSPHASNSENEEETPHSHSDEDRNEDIEKQIKINTLLRENSASKCLDNFKRNNKDLTIKSLSEKNTSLPQTGSPRKKQEEPMRITNKACKDISVKPIRTVERQENDNEVLTKNDNQYAATSSSSQKVANQVNTVKTVKTFQSETIIEEITTTVTKTIRTVNQSSKQVAKNVNVPAYRPRLMVPNQQSKPLQAMTVRNAPSVGTKIRNATPRPSVPTKPIGQLVPVRAQSQIIPRQLGIVRPSAPGPSNIKKIPPQTTAQKPVVGKPLKISPLAMNQTGKRASEITPSHFSCFKKPKNTMIPSMDSFDDETDDSMVNYSSASSSRSDFSTTSTKLVKGKSVVTATQARSEQHSEQHITKLNNMAGIKIMRTSTKQSSQVETKNNMSAAKRTAMDAIEKLQKQGLLIKKPCIEAPAENEHYDSDSEGGEEYEEND